MQMQMGHCLPPLPTTAYSQTVAPFRNTLLPGYLTSNVYHMSHERRVSFSKLSQRGDMTHGYDQDMHRRLGIYVTEGKYFFIPIDGIAGYLPAYNLAENAVHFPSLSGPAEPDNDGISYL
jgi:hypothetical protein